MSSPLARLRRDLARLGRRRAFVRLGTAAATAGLLLFVALGVAFMLDYLADLRPLQRAVALLGIAFTGGWIASSIVGRWLTSRETETDLALLVDDRQGLRGDLVAALQFQSSEASAWGSPQLAQAVVRDVDEATREFDSLDGFSWRPLPGRIALLGLCLAAVVAVTALFPRHATTFLDRLTLADVPYPTRTIVTSLTINGTQIDLAGDAHLRVPAGAAVTFVATTSGVRPDEGFVSIEATRGGATQVTLTSAATSNSTPPPSRSHAFGAQDPPAPHPPRASTFTGNLDALTQPITFTVRLGDAETRPRRIDVVPRPVVALDLVPTPPAYARTNAPASPPAGARSTFVLEGSNVEVVVRGVSKPLRTVILQIERAQDRKAVTESTRASNFDLTPSSDRKTWTLSPAGTPFENVREPIIFSIAATDDEGLAPAAPVNGSIRLRADRPPQVAAGAVVKQVLPTGRPELSYGASDDFGVKQMRANVSVTHAAGAVEEFSVPLPIEHETVTDVTGRHALDLSAYGLEKGDRLVVTVEAEDARGDKAGESAAAEPILFEVTDREGLLASLLDSDEVGAERLDAIIRRELGISGREK